MAGILLLGSSVVTIPSAGALSQRSIINWDFFDDHFTYAFINHALMGAWVEVFSGMGNIPLSSILDSTTGYVSSSATIQSSWNIGGTFQMPASSNFNGPWVVAWTGEGEIQANWDFFAEANSTSSIVVSSLTSGSATINSAAQSFVAGLKINPSTTIGNISTANTYYVSATSLTSLTVQLSTTYVAAIAGTPVVTPSVSGTVTLTPKGAGSYIKNANGIWTKTAANGLDAYIVVTGSTNFSSRPFCTPTNETFIRLSGGTDGPLHNMRWYRLADEDDLLAGNIFRTPFKQQLVSLRPSAIRFMNWHGGNMDGNCRWEYKVTPANASYSANNASGPAYSAPSMTVANQYTVTAVTSVGAPYGTPTSMVHGEYAQIPMNTPLTVRSASGFQAVTNITNANPAVVTQAAHGWQSSDWVIFKTTGGMANLHLVPKNVTVIDTTSFSFANPIGAALGTFNSATVGAYISLNVGTGNDRAPTPGYPLMFFGGAYACTFGSASNQINGIKGYYFDKNVVGHYDGANPSVPVKGAWLMNSDAPNTAISGVPPSICTALINELNILSTSQGITTPIHMWFNCPYRGLASIDPDYSSGSNWIVNAVGDIINGSSYNGVTYAPLSANATLFVEYSNELWNRFASFSPGAYLQSYENSRWGSSAGASTFQDAYALRATCMARDLHTAFSSNPRIKTVMGLWAATGFFPGDFGGNYYSIFPSSINGTLGNFYYTDSAVTGGSWGLPINNIDAIAIATYMDPISSYANVSSGTGCFTDDSAMYNGLNNSGNGGGNYSGAANQNQAITNFTNSILLSAEDGTGYISFTQSGGKFDQFSSGISSGITGLTSKFVLQYEGGQDWNVQQGTQFGSITISSNNATFIQASQASSQWGAVLVAIHNNFCTRANCKMPANYQWENVNTAGGAGSSAVKWSFVSPDAYASGIEGQALLNTLSWVALSSRNQQLTV